METEGTAPATRARGNTPATGTRGKTSVGMFLFMQSMCTVGYCMLHFVCVCVCVCRCESRDCRSGLMAIAVALAA